MSRIREVQINGRGEEIEAVDAGNNGGSGVWGVSTGNGDGGYFQASSGTGGYFTSITGYALVTGTGNVGVGSSNPQWSLDLGATAKYIGWGSYSIGVNGSGVVVLNEGAWPTGYDLRTASSAGMYINSSGNVGIGTTTPYNGAQLSVYGSSNPFGISLLSSGSNAGIELDDTGAVTGRLVPALLCRPSDLPNFIFTTTLLLPHG